MDYQILKTKEKDTGSYYIRHQTVKLNAGILEVSVVCPKIKDIPYYLADEVMQNAITNLLLKTNKILFSV